MALAAGTMGVEMNPWVSMFAALITAVSDGMTVTGSSLITGLSSHSVVT